MENFIDHEEDGFKLSLFDVDESGKETEIETEEPVEEPVEEKEQPEKVEKEIETPEVETEEEDEQEEEQDEDKGTEGENLEDKPEDDQPLSKEEEILSELVSSGHLLLPDDYEYEPTKEGLQKAFEDSEALRNQLAFQEAIKFLISDDGLDFAKVQKAQSEAKSLTTLDPEKMSDDEKLDLIKEFYKSKGYEEADIEETIEDIIDSNKIDKELNVATKFLKKDKEKEIEVEARRMEQERVESERQLAESQKMLRTKLAETKEINGYTLAEDNKPKIYEILYKPVRTKSGELTTEFNSRLQAALSDPDKTLVLADLLLNMNDKGFDFSKMITKVESRATNSVKKSLRDLKNTSGKPKSTGKAAQTHQDFDLSKASLFMK